MAFFDAVQKSLSLSNIGEPIVVRPKDIEVVETKPIPAPPQRLKKAIPSAV